MAPFSPIPPRHPIRVVLSSTALQPFVSVRKAAALAIAQLGVAAFFMPGIARDTLGESAVWFVIAAAVVAAFARAVDIESWALLIPGGLSSRVTRAFGQRAAGPAKAAALVERILLGALACVVVGHYVAGVSATAIGGWRFTGNVRPEDLTTLIAAGVIGLLWLRARLGRDVTRDTLARAVWIGIGIVVLAMVWGVITLARRGFDLSPLLVPPPTPAITTWRPLDAVLAYVLGFALTLPVIGGGDALARAAHELTPPRVRALRRTALLALVFTLVATGLGTVMVLLLVPASEQALWANAPLAGLAQYLAGPSSLRDVMAVALAAAAALILVPAAHAAFRDTEQMLHRASSDGTLPEGLASLHARFGTPARAVDVTVAAMILVVLASGARITWLARGYAIATAVLLVLTIAALVRLRRLRQEPGGVQGAREPAPQDARGSAGAAGDGRYRRHERGGHDPCRGRGGDCGGGSHLGLVALVHDGRATAGARRDRPRRQHVRPAARGRAVAQSDRGPSRQRPGAGPQSASARPRRRRPPDRRGSRRGRDDGAAARRRRRRRGRRPDHAHAVRAPAAVGRGRAGGARRPSGAPADRAHAERGRCDRRALSSASAHRTCTSANRPRCRPRTRRAYSARPGSAPTSPRPSTCGWSCITAADGPTRITSAPTHRLSLRATST